MRQYLNRIEPIIERLVVDLLVEMPEDFASYASDWFKDKGAKMANGETVTLPSDHKDIKAGISVRSEEFQFNVNPPADYEKPHIDSEEDEDHSDD